MSHYLFAEGRKPLCISDIENPNRTKTTGRTTRASWRQGSKQDEGCFFCFGKYNNKADTLETKRGAIVWSKYKVEHLQRADTNTDKETREDGWSGGGSQQALFLGRIFWQECELFRKYSLHTMKQQTIKDYTVRHINLRERLPHKICSANRQYVNMLWRFTN